MTIDEALQPLRNGLYEATARDWILWVNLVLTEPVCPTIGIGPEGYSLTRYRVDVDLPIADAIITLADVVYDEVVRRIPHPVFVACPFSGDDDENFARWLTERGPFPEPMRLQRERESERDE